MRVPSEREHNSAYIKWMMSCGVGITNAGGTVGVGIFAVGMMILRDNCCVSSSKCVMS